MLALFISGLFPNGCAAPLAKKQDSIDIDGSEYARVYHACVQVLREDGFTLDRQDFRFGVITTKPIADSGLEQLRRPRSHTMAQAVESTFHDQRRRVNITLKRQDQSQQPPMAPGLKAKSTQPVEYALRVEVQIERRQIPKRHLTQSTAGHRILRNLARNPYELEQREIRGEYWQPMGRDLYHGQHLLAAIIRKSILLGDKQVTAKWGRTPHNRGGVDTPH